MKKTLFFIILTVAVTAFMFSCEKASQDIVGGTVTCDTSAVSYQHDLVPILQEYCYNCHGTHVSAAGGGIILEGYMNLSNYAANGLLIGDINFASGYTGMPYGKPKLSTCELNKFTAWVNQGILDN